jgi:ATP-dependent Zn protease
MLMRMHLSASAAAGAELANVVNEAALLAARRGSDTVGLQDLLEGVQRTRFGVNGGPNKQGGLQQRLNKWLLDGVAEQAKRPVKVSTA